MIQNISGVSFVKILIQEMFTTFESMIVGSFLLLLIGFFTGSAIIFSYMIAWFFGMFGV